MTLHDDGVQALADVLADLPPLGPWVTAAACRGQGEVFTSYPQRRAAVELVERTCRACPVRADCLAYADEHPSPGVWAGEWHGWSGDVHTLEQRLARPSVTCGTAQGYRRHLRQSEAPCTPCREAHNALCRQRKRNAA